MRKRKPLPITDMRMRRFLITLKQAIDLVFSATKHMKGGEIFVPNLPACYIKDLIVALAGKNYPTKMVGIRPGEKLDEVLISEEEVHRTRRVNDRYFEILPHRLDSKNFLPVEFSSASTRQLTIPEIKALLKESEKC